MLPSWSTARNTELGLVPMGSRASGPPVSADRRASPWPGIRRSSRRDRDDPSDQGNWPGAKNDAKSFAPLALRSQAKARPVVGSMWLGSTEKILWTDRTNEL